MRHLQFFFQLNNVNLCNLYRIVKSLMKNKITKVKKSAVPSANYRVQTRNVFSFIDRNAYVSAILDAGLSFSMLHCYNQVTL